MKTTIVIIFIFLVPISFGQTNKTLKDSVFKKGDIINISEIAYDNCKVRPESKASLKLIGEFLTSHKNLIVEIANHTDYRGSAEANIKLSNCRATSTWDYLIYEYKLDTAFVKYKGYGENRPIIKEETILKTETTQEKERLCAINRRTELIILDVK